jgi:TetR/AcrR family transcriptional regulator, transcriptional repressor of bet genes
VPGARASEEVRRSQMLRAAFEVASREGIGGLTVRAVAAEAGLSHGLVHFHFKRKERLVHALLDWLVDTVSVLHVPEEIARLTGARERLDALLEQEMERLSHHPGHVRLFYEFGVLGARHEPIRARIGAELARYHVALAAVMEEVLRADPEAFPGANADSLATVAVSWIHGAAVQAMVYPGRFDAEGYRAAVLALAGGDRAAARAVPAPEPGGGA